MNKSLLALALSLGVLSSAAASGHDPNATVHWTPASWHDSMKNMPKGDVNAGEKLHTSLFCASCHGIKGESMTDNWPSLAGQPAAYTYKQLLDYQSGLRQEDARGHVMFVVAQMLDRQQMADLAAFYAAQPQPCPQGLPKPAPSLVTAGDPKRLITPCAACHGANGQGGINETTALRGMPKDYFIRTMRLFRDGQRHNDVAHGMSQFAKPLTDAEIQRLADYYACTPASATAKAE
ncbi:c-type cytochrome [Halothiobacillus sp. DCM-1]|uniref:c-type cytochrome n=1 Tax=Halothiobacillus sp. DCM-1 TaxID=3112558 RepID=UPI00324B53B3